MSDNAASPLVKYTRQPKLYIDLPSKGVWYPKDKLEKSEELEVYSMTATDEIAIKTPDGLYTGQTVVRLIQNCVPAIKDAWYVPSCDLEYILGAIRLATYGDSIEMKSKCKECEAEDAYSVSTQSILDHLVQSQFQSEVAVDDIVIKIRPLTYKEVTELQQTTLFVQRAIVKKLNSLEASSEEDGAKSEAYIKELYDKINSATQDGIINSVIAIDTPEGAETNLQFIREFLLNAGEPKYYNALTDLYQKNGIRIKAPESTIQCSECEHEYKIRPQLDYASFFVR